MAPDASKSTVPATLESICIESKLSEASTSLLLEANAEDTLLSDWVAILTDERPYFLRALQQLGVTSLGERQRFANALAKASRESRLPEACQAGADARREELARDRLARLWERSASPPPLDEIERDAAARLRAYATMPARSARGSP